MHYPITCCYSRDGALSCNAVVYSTDLVLQDNGLDIKAMPEFVHLTKDGTQMSGMLFTIIVEKAV